MDLVAYYIENELVILSLCAAGFLLLIRCIVLLYSMVLIVIKHNWRNSFFNIAPRFLFPGHLVLFKKPLKFSGRALFHLCLLLTPLGIYQHIELWQDSGFDWALLELPDSWVDWLSIWVMLNVIYFASIRLFSSHIRSESSINEYLLLGIAGLPFFSGFFLSGGQLNHIPWFAENLYTLHVLSGELFIVTLGILCCKTKINRTYCTACAACTLGCPSLALSMQDVSGVRKIQYSPSLCILCGNCERICPDNAAKIGHSFNLPNPFKLHRLTILQKLPLVHCQQCSHEFVPEKQIQKLNKMAHDDCLSFCPRCRQNIEAEKLYNQVFHSAVNIHPQNYKNTKLSPHVCESRTGHA